ncbi:hypothetical protein B2M26_11490 [Ferroacidibacillus organovorans]|uniref:Flagellar protein FliL n=2 Tax=Ferroacidibacillus organovorans TaxID=1765683 RepID=A0A1V4ES51_9BACL|nr:hypothetical protein B2M26_11490 [Ferroacidibacillus organovorans]
MRCRMNARKVSFILIPALAVVVLGGAAAYKFLFSSKVHAPPTAAQLQSWQYNVDKITTNLQGSSMIQIQLTLQALSTKVDTELTERNAQLDDVVIGVLHNLSASQIEAPGGRTYMKDLILKRVNAILTTGKITAVYIQNMIVQ